MRNVEDAMLRALAENGGVVMINFFDAMVNRTWTPTRWPRCTGGMAGGAATSSTTGKPSTTSRPNAACPALSSRTSLNHIDHAVDVAGIDHVGLGSDFDGVFDLPSGLEDVTRLPWITYGLLQRGYSEADVYKILGGNVLRVMEEARRVAEKSLPL